MLIYLCVKVDWIVSFVGNYSLSVPALGGLEGSFGVKEEVQLNLGLSGQLASMKPKSISWNQTYLDLESS